MKLTDKQKLQFCDAYAKTHSIVEAASAAGISDHRASILLRTKSIQRAVEDIRRDLSGEEILSKPAWLTDLNNKRLADIGDYYDCVRDRDGKFSHMELRPLDELTPIQRRCIKKLNIQFGLIELHDAVKAGETMAAALGYNVPSDSDDNKEQLALTLNFTPWGKDT